MAWRPPELPPLQKMPRKRPNAGKPSLFGRAVAGLAGIAFGVSGLLGAYNAFRDTSGQGSPFGAFAMLMPAALLIRYALTGQIKIS